MSKGLMPDAPLRLHYAVAAVTDTATCGYGQPAFRKFDLEIVCMLL